MRNYLNMKFMKILVQLIWSLVKIFWVIVGGLWTTMEILNTIFSQSTLVGKLHDNAVIYFSIPLVFAIGQLIRKYRLKEKIGTKSIEIRYGDIIECKNGSIVLGINNQGISESRIINDDSIHGQLMKRYGEKDVSEAIKNSNGDIIKFKSSKDGKNKDFLMIRMSNINQYGVAEAEAEQVKEAIHKLFWNQHEYEIINNTLFMPLLGTGTAGIIPSRLEVLETIIKEFICFQRDRVADAQRDVITHLIIVIRWRDINAVSPEKVTEILKQYVEYCFQCNRIKEDIKEI